MTRENKLLSNLRSVWIVRPTDHPRNFNEEAGVWVEDTCNKNGLTWAIKRAGFCLNHEGMWEFEPIPSSRDEDFYKRCRWFSANAAIEFANKWLKEEVTA